MTWYVYYIGGRYVASVRIENIVPVSGPMRDSVEAILLANSMNTGTVVY